jgi:hypothetical protein
MVDLEESFEYERKFLVTNPDVIDGVIPEFILQGYLTVAEHYAVRVRLVADGSDQSLDVLRREKECRELLGKGLFPFDSAILAVKSPSTGGIRYEAEMDLAVDVAEHLCRLSLGLVVKDRYPIIHGDDLWVVDVFHGINSPLVVAECERDAPVEDLVVPDFCGLEVTNDLKYANESLAVEPFISWK